MAPRDKYLLVVKKKFNILQLNFTCGVLFFAKSWYFYFTHNIPLKTLAFGFTSPFSRAVWSADSAAATPERVPPASFILASTVLWFLSKIQNARENLGYIFGIVRFIRRSLCFFLIWQILKINLRSQSQYWQAFLVTTITFLPFCKLHEFTFWREPKNEKTGLHGQIVAWNASASRYTSHALPSKRCFFSFLNAILRAFLWSRNQIVQIYVSGIHERKS